MLRPRAGIESLVPTSHGGINYAELEKFDIPPGEVLDFSVSTNPYGPPPGIEKVLIQTAVDSYPDSESSEFKLLLSKKLKVSPDNLLIGSGSTELIRLVVTAYFGSGDTVIIPQPTYGEYEIACRIAGTEVIRQPLQEAKSFRLNVKETVELIHSRHPKGIFLCNPNNPTGHYLSRDEVLKIVTAAKNTLVILDEAYIAFTENPWIATDLVKRSNLIVLRSMTKDYALAGLRLGYLIASKPIVSVLHKVKPPWNVSAGAQAAGVFVLGADSYLKKCQVKTKQAKEYLVAELKKLGFLPLPSQSNFFMVKVGNAKKIRNTLLKKGILVRDCASFGLPDYIRLAPRTMADCRKLIITIKNTGVDKNGG